MPRVMFVFERQRPRDLPNTYRVVDRSDAGLCASDFTNATVELYQGRDAMGVERWAPAGQEGIDALLNEIVYFTVTRNETVAEPVAV